MAAVVAYTEALPHSWCGFALRHPVCWYAFQKDILRAPFYPVRGGKALTETFVTIYQ